MSKQQRTGSKVGDGVLEGNVTPRMGFAREKDLLDITCALLTNANVYPFNTEAGVVNIANKVLIEIEAKTRQ